MKNKQTEQLIEELKKASSKENVNIWKRIASDLTKSKRRIVNLSKISKYSKDDLVIVVPGKVLGMGVLDKKVKIAAQSFSSQALEKITSGGSTAISIQELVKENPKGSKVLILG